MCTPACLTSEDTQMYMELMPLHQGLPDTTQKQQHELSDTANIKSKLHVEAALKTFGACFKTVVVKWQGKGIAEKLAFTSKPTAADRYRYMLWN